MKKLMLFIAVGVLITSSFFLTMCKSTQYSKEIAYVDSLLVVLDKREALLNEIDTVEIQRDFRIYLDNLDRIREQFTDRDDEETWSIYTRYGLIRKPLRDYKKNYDEMMVEINYARRQLNALKENLKHNTYEPDVVEEYIREETSFVNYIDLTVENLHYNTTRYHNMFKELNPQVEDLLED